MDIIITICCLVIAVCIVLGKPINIIITHKIANDNPVISGPTEQELQEQATEEAQRDMVNILNNFYGMGSDVNE